MGCERFNKLRVIHSDRPKSERGFEARLAGSQVLQFAAFFPFDFAEGGLDYFDVKVIEVRDLIDDLSEEGCNPDFAIRPRNMRHIEAMCRSMTSNQWEAA